MVGRTIDRRGDRLVRAIAIYTALLASGLTVLIVVRSAGIGVLLAFVVPLFLASWFAVRYRGRLSWCSLQSWSASPASCTVPTARTVLGSPT